MAILETLGLQAASSAAGSIGNTVGEAIGGGVEKLFGIDRNKEQLEQQQALTNMQLEASRSMAGYNYGLQKDMYNYTYNKNTPAAIKQNLIDAGMNPALIYGMSGGVGSTATGSGGGTAGSGTAANKAELIAARTQQQQMAIQREAVMSQIKLNEAQAEKAKAEAKNVGEQTTTEINKRDIFIENMRQQGIQSWIENTKEKYKLEKPKDETIDGVTVTKNYNKNLDASVVIGDGIFTRQVAAELARTLAETGAIDAQAVLTNNKAQGYWTELLNDTMKAEAAKKQGDAAEANSISERIKANAQNLATQWGTGEYTNWKTWRDLAMQGTQIAISAIK